MTALTDKLNAAENAMGRAITAAKRSRLDKVKLETASAIALAQAALVMMEPAPAPPVVVTPPPPPPPPVPPPPPPAVERVTIASKAPYADVVDGVRLVAKRLSVGAPQGAIATRGPAGLRPFVRFRIHKMTDAYMGIGLAPVGFDTSGYGVPGDEVGESGFYFRTDGWMNVDGTALPTGLPSAVEGIDILMAYKTELGHVRVGYEYPDGKQVWGNRVEMRTLVGFVPWMAVVPFDYRDHDIEFIDNPATGPGGYSSYRTGVDYEGAGIPDPVLPPAPPPPAPGEPAPPKAPPPPLPEVTDEAFGVQATGGGGFVTSMAQDNKVGARIVGTDTTSPYVKLTPGDDWQAVVTLATMPKRFYDGTTPYQYGILTDGAGCYGVAAVARPDGQVVFYYDYWGYTFKNDTSLKGESRVVAGPHRHLANHGESRVWNDKFATHPGAPEVVLVGHQGSDAEFGGVYLYDTRGADTVSYRLQGLPDILSAPEPYPHLVAIDPKAPLKDGLPQRMAVAVYGTGMFLYENGPTSQPKFFPGGPDKIKDFRFDDHGRITAGQEAVAYNPHDALWLWENGVWTNIIMPAEKIDMQCFAVDPNNRDQMYAMNVNGGLFPTSKDATGKYVWTGSESNIYPWPQYYRADKAKWLGSHVVNGVEQPLGGFFPSKMMFDRLLPGRLNFAHGTGTAYFDAKQQGDATRDGVPGRVYHDDTPNIENLVSTFSRSMPSGERRQYRGGMDKGCFWNKPGTYAETRGPEDVYFTHGWQLDRSPSGRVAVLWATQWSRDCSYSINDGRFTKMKNQPPEDYKNGGDVVVVDDTTVIVAPGNNGRAFYTTDLGETPWKPLQLRLPDGRLVSPGGDTESGWSWAWYFNKKIMVASKQTPGKVWAFNYGPTIMPEVKGVWEWPNFLKDPTDCRIIDSTATNGWQWYPYHVQMEEVPGVPNLLLITAGNDQGQPAMVKYPGTDKFVPLPTSFDGQALPYFTSVLNWGFGKGKNPGDPVVIRFFGQVGEHMGLFETSDLFKTLKHITRYPAGVVYDSLRYVQGDLNRYGWWYYGYGASGHRYSRKNDAEAWT